MGLMYVQVVELIKADGTADLSDSWINTDVVEEIVPYGTATATPEDRYCTIRFQSGRVVSVTGSAYAIQAWWYQRAQPPLPSKETP